MVTKLHHILKPFLLRRVKSDVETSLPPKREIILYARLTSKQLEIEHKLVDKTLITEIQEQVASKSGRSTSSFASCLLSLQQSSSQQWNSHPQ
jgi:ATP-dependent DNA helicase